MTRTQDRAAEDSRSRRRHLKPVVEKKRRDRINQSLAELRSLLLNHTSDPRLKNPKIEKAEILDLAVEYLKKWSEGKNQSNASGHMKTLVPAANRPASSASLFTVENAGFHQCVAQLTNYMHKVAPSQRTSLIEGLKRHTEGQSSNATKPDFSQRAAETEAAKWLHAASAASAASAAPFCTSERKEEPPKLFPSLSPFQPHSCSTPCHEYLSPPPSPWLSPSFSTYATSPSFPSFAPHFSSPPSLSPLSSNTSLFSFSPGVLHSGPPALLCPALTMPRTPPHPAQREGSPTNSSSAMWRPWF